VPLGRKGGLDPSDIVLDGDRAPPPPKRGQSPQFSAHVYWGTAQPPNFGPYLLWPNGWMDQDATWYEGRPRPRPLSVTLGPSSRSQKGRASNFRPVSIVAKRSPISATAEHLYVNPAVSGTPAGGGVTHVEFPRDLRH